MENVRHYKHSDLMNRNVSTSCCICKCSHLQGRKQKQTSSYSFDTLDLRFLRSTRKLS